MTKHKSHRVGHMALVATACLMGLQLLRAQETVVVQAASVRTWEDILRWDGKAERDVDERRYVPPPGRIPGERKIVMRGTDQFFQPREESSRQSFMSTPEADLDLPDVVLPPALDFEALPDNNTAIPPDTYGAAGPSHLMTMLNTQVRIQNKLGGAVSTVSLASFWTGSTGLTGSAFDPKILYDAIHGRWLATCLANPNTDSSKVFFAISSTNNPTGAWSYYSFVADAGDTTWADFPGMGMNTTWIAITTNMFRISPSPSSVASKMWVIDKATALVPGGPLTVTVFPTGFDLSGGVDGFTLQPCATFGPEPTLYLVDNSGYVTSPGGVHVLRLSRITGTGSTPAWSVVPGSLFTGTGLFTVTNNFNSNQIRASQLGSDSLLETNDTRVLNAVFRNGRIWCTHSGGLPIVPSVSNRTAVFWYQLNPAAMPAPIVQSGILDGGVGVHHYFPSITANSANDALVGFSRSNTGRYVEGVYAGRLGTDPSGTMRPIAVLKAGLDSYEKKFSGTRIRWGDYSASVVDPSDDISFWSIQEYAALDVGPGPDDDRWGTWWVRIDVITGVAESMLPASTSLLQNFPNPFNPSTTFSYKLATRGVVSLKVYDILGQEITTLVNAERSPGEYSLQWTPHRLSGGTYFYRLQAGDYSESRKLIILD